MVSEEKQISVRRKELGKYIDSNGCYEDLGGNKFSTFVDLVTAYGLREKNTLSFIDNGYSLKDILIKTGVDPKTVEGTAIKVFEEFYPSLNKIGAVFGFSSGTMSIYKDDIEGYLMSQEIIKFEGKIYRSYSALADDYNMTVEQLTRRLRAGWTIRKALTTPINKRCSNRVPVKDHLGNTFPCKADMLAHYKITYDAFSRRTKANWSLEDTLTTPMKHFGSKANSTALNKLAVIV